ncbi:hypothetical protein L1887_18033 [Cichorium endivia]|nr:hypothetical protein L1887_18033 [Cichorium endivia]
MSSSRSSTRICTRFTSLLYGAEDPSIAGMVLDSAFSNSFNLMLELVDGHKIRLPKFTIKQGQETIKKLELKLVNSF